MGTPFNANAVDTTVKEFTVAPEGVYQLIITNAEYGSNKKGNGTLVSMEFALVHDEHKGKVWEYYNILNPSEKAQQIGQGQFGRICKAIGMPNVDLDNLAPMIDKVFHADLKHEESEYEGKVKTKLRIKKAIIPGEGDEAVETEHPATEAPPIPAGTDGIPF